MSDYVCRLSFLFAEQIESGTGGAWFPGFSSRRWLFRRLIRPGFRVSGLLALHEFARIEQRASQRRVVAGPRSLRLALACLMCSHRLHFRIQIVEVMQHERFRKHRQLGRSKIILPVVADDQMFQQRFQLGREVRKLF